MVNWKYTYAIFTSDHFRGLFALFIIMVILLIGCFVYLTFQKKYIGAGASIFAIIILFGSIVMGIDYTGMYNMNLETPELKGETHGYLITGHGGCYEFSGDGTRDIADDVAYEMMEKQINDDQKKITSFYNSLSDINDEQVELLSRYKLKNSALFDHVSVTDFHITSNDTDELMLQYIHDKIILSDKWSDKWSDTKLALKSVEDKSHDTPERLAAYNSYVDIYKMIRLPENVNVIMNCKSKSTTCMFNEFQYFSHPDSKFISNYKKAQEHKYNDYCVYTDIMPNFTLSLDEKAWNTGIYELPIRLDGDPIDYAKQKNVPLLSNALTKNNIMNNTLLFPVHKFSLLNLKKKFKIRKIITQIRMRTSGIINVFIGSCLNGCDTTDGTPL
jgi:hypothetical protein